MKRRLLYALLPVTILLLAAELAARWVPPPPVPTGSGPQMQAHPSRYWAMPSGHFPPYTIGPDGLRTAPERSGRRVLTLGDSTIFGWDLDDTDTLHVRLAEELAERGVPADVRCGGIPAYSTVQTQVLLDEVGWALEPELLVVANLLSDSAIGAYADTELRLPVFGSRLLLRLSQWGLHRTGRNAWRTLSWPQPGDVGKRRVPLRDYGENLDRILAQAGERGVGVIVLQLATRRTAEDGLQPDDGLYPYAQLQRQVAERRGVGVVEVLPVVEASGLSAEDAYPDWVHPVAEISRGTATHLAEALVEAGWPEQSLVPQELAPWSEPADDPWETENRYEPQGVQWMLSAPEPEPRR